MTYSWILRLENKYPDMVNDSYVGAMQEKIKRTATTLGKMTPESSMKALGQYVEVWGALTGLEKKHGSDAGYRQLVVEVDTRIKDLAKSATLRAITNYQAAATKVRADPSEAKKLLSDSEAYIAVSSRIADSYSSPQTEPIKKTVVALNNKIKDLRDKWELV